MCAEHHFVSSVNVCIDYVCVMFTGWGGLQGQKDDG